MAQGTHPSWVAGEEKGPLMPSKNRNRHPKGRLIPGGKGPAGLREWKFMGLFRVTEWVKALCAKHTVPTLAEMSGVPIGSLRNVRDGGRDPTPEMAQKIAAAVNANLDDVVKGRAA